MKFTKIYFSQTEVKLLPIKYVERTLYGGVNISTLKMFKQTLSDYSIDNDIRVHTV